MYTNNLKKHFIPLHETQREDILEFVAKKRINLFVWEKGKAQKELFTPYRFNSKTSLLSLLPQEKETSTENRNIIFNFEMNQIFYFGTGDISLEGEDLFVLHVDKELYKTEKRENFRIYSNKEDFTFKFEEVSFLGNSLSTGGIGLFVTQDQVTSFTFGKAYGPAVLRFSENDFEIPIFRPLYVRKNHENDLILGINFLNLSEDTEARLFREINKFLYVDFAKE